MRLPVSLNVISIFLLLIMFASINSASGVLQSTSSISSIGSIRKKSNYQISLNKTITWIDGSRETIQISQKGAIFLNGYELIAFGFNLCDDPYFTVTSSLANIILDRIQADGIRFIALGITNGMTHSWSETVRYFNFWLPKLYQHKIFVTLQIAHKGVDKPANINFDYQYPWFAQVIDLFNVQPYANMLFALGVYWEWDGLFATDTTTRNQNQNAAMEASCSQLYSALKSKLQSTQIGDIPIYAKPTEWYDKHGTVQMLKYSDIPAWDLYLIIQNIGDYDPSVMNSRMTGFRNLMTMAGKDTQTYKLWFSEAGTYKSSSGVYYDNPGIAMARTANMDFFLTVGGHGNLGAIFVWNLYWSTKPTWTRNLFNSDGTPRPWYTVVVNYFPKVG